MKVSVLIPYYNDREYLPIAIESVLNQTYRDFELILVNHATTDDCREIAHSYKDDRIIHIDMDRNYGAGTGLITKKFLEKATGEYVKPFCADDVMYPNCLEDLVKYAKNYPNVDMIFGDVEHIDKKGKSLNNSWFQSKFGFSLENKEADCLNQFFRGRSILPYIGSLVKKEKYNNIDIDVSCIMSFDTLLWSSLLLSGCKLGYLNKYVAGYRIHENQMCSCKNLRLIIARGIPEVSALAYKYLDMKDIDLVRKVFKTNPFIKKADSNDIRFIVAYEMLLSDISSISFMGYNILHNMLQNEQTRDYLEHKFHFGIYEFRKIYSNFSVPNESTELYLYCILKRFLRKISFYKYWQKSNKKFK